MSRKTKDPLREPTEPERQERDRLSGSQSAPAAEVIRARILPAVARGYDYQTAARSVGRRSGDAGPHLVARFDTEGLEALTPRHGGGRAPTCGPQERARIAAEAARAPTPEGDGTATWSLSTSRRTPRAAPDGLPKVSTDAIRGALHEAGSSYRRTRTWGPTGRALRRRKAGPAVVAGPGPDARKSGSRPPTSRGRRRASPSGASTRPGRTGRSRTPARPGGPRVTRRDRPTSPSATARPRR
jgi:transposase